MSNLASIESTPISPRMLSDGRISKLEDLYEAASDLNFTPGWVPRAKPILWAEPRPELVPAHWTYQEAKAGLDAAGRLIDVSLAERRNLVMRNPAPGTNFETTRTLVCAYQMILPGEFAPAHRHSSHALRVIIDGEGSFSVVNGEKTPMETGDVVLTPGWCWHAHGHEGTSLLIGSTDWTCLSHNCLSQCSTRSTRKGARRLNASLRPRLIGSPAPTLRANSTRSKLIQRDFTAR